MSSTASGSDEPTAGGGTEPTAADRSTAPATDGSAQSTAAGERETTAVGGTEPTADERETTAAASTDRMPEDETDQKRSGRRRPEGPAHPRKGSALETIKRTFSEFSEDNLTTASRVGSGVSRDARVRATQVFGSATSETRVGE